MISDVIEKVAIKIRSLAALTASSPTRVFWWFVAAHLALWTVLPAITSPNAPLDVIEGYAWGREWLLGTYKHPTMQAWILETLAFLSGRAFWSHFLASQIAVVVAFWAVWQTGRRIMGERQALIGTLLLEGVIYYNFTSTEFNPNVLQLAFWALAGLSFHRAVTEQKLIDWILLGVWSAGGLYSKYSTALLLAVYAWLMIQRPEARRCLKTPGPYIAAFVTLVLFAPHLWWLQQNDFIPFTYVKDRLVASGPATKFVTPPAFFPTFLLSPIVFVVAQLLAMLPALFLLLLLDEKNDQTEPVGLKKLDRAFLTATTFAPMVMTLIMAILFGFKIHDMWGAPFFNFAGLWAIAFFFQARADIRPRFATAWLILFFAAALGMATNNFLAPYIGGKVQRITFPGEALSREVLQGWHDHFDQPLEYAIGDTWFAGNVAYYAPERPHVFINADPVISPWINPDQVKEKGGVVVWCQLYCSRDDDGHSMSRGQPDYLTILYPDAEIQTPLIIPRETGADVYPVTFGWAIIPPHKKASR